MVSCTRPLSRPGIQSRILEEAWERFHGVNAPGTTQASREDRRHGIFPERETLHARVNELSSSNGKSFTPWTLRERLRWSREHRHHGIIPVRESLHARLNAPLDTETQTLQINHLNMAFTDLWAYYFISCSQIVHDSVACLDNSALALYKGIPCK